MTDRRTTLVSAALRHVRDAELLLDTSHGRSSPDQAFHLAGYGPECVRKATLSIDWLDKAIGHQMVDNVDDLLAAAVALDPIAVRYEITGWSDRYRALSCWTEQSRYERTGTRAPEVVQALLEEARAIVDGLVLALWMDGRLPEGIR
jgi:hypothetical protein